MMLTDQQLQSLRNMGNEAEAAADEIGRLRADLARVNQWQRDGEELIPSRASWSALFHIGCWWADRPWRKRA